MLLSVYRAKLGVAAAFLPVLNYVLLKFSRHVAHQLVSSGYEVQFLFLGNFKNKYACRVPLITVGVVQLQGKTDARFVEAAFKIFRDKFGLRPVITAAQFLEQASLFFSTTSKSACTALLKTSALGYLQGFAERKLLLLSDVIAYCKSFHNAAVRRARLAAASAPTKASQQHL